MAVKLNQGHPLYNNWKMYVHVDQTSGDLVNLADSSLNGTLTGASYATDATQGKVVAFDGTNDKISFGTSFNAADYSGWSAGAVFTVDALAVEGLVIGQWAAGSEIWRLTVTTGGAVIFRRGTDAGGSYLVPLTANGKVVAGSGNWHAAVCTMDEGTNTAKLYFGSDAAITDNTTSGTKEVASGSELMLGLRGDASNDFQGKIKTAFLADTVMTAAQVATWTADPTSVLAGLQTNVARVPPRQYIYTRSHNGLRENQAHDELTWSKH